MYSVVNIGGVSHSGSTVLGRIVANDDRAMFLGEIEALFRPTRKHHYEYIRRLEKTSLWADLLRNDVHEIYPGIFDKCRHKDVLVDCSKSPLWICARNADCRNNGLAYRNVLIYKSPYELAESYNSRKKNWAEIFEKYMRRYFRCVDEFYVIAYRDLLEEPSALEGLCAYLGLQYNEGKKSYWNNPVEELFGSEKANTRRSLKYVCRLGRDQKHDVKAILGQRIIAEKLWKVLDENRNQVCNTQDKQFNELRVSKAELSRWATVNRVKKRYKGMFPEDYFKRRIVQ